jgi:hypothetical protein
LKCEQDGFTREDALEFIQHIDEPELYSSEPYKIFGMAISSIAGGTAAVIVGILCALAEGCSSTTMSGSGSNDCFGYIFGCIGVVLGGLIFLAITAMLWAILAFYVMQTSQMWNTMQVIDNAVENG